MPAKGDNSPQCETVDSDGVELNARTVVNSDTETSGVGRFLGVVETALARVLTLAAEAGKWDVVRAVTAELERRTVAREGVALAQVVTLPTKAAG